MYACVLVKLYCLFHNRCDEIRGQVSDSTTACHGNTHLLGATLASCAHTLRTHIFVHNLLTRAALIVRVITCFAPVLLTRGRFDLHLSLQSVTLYVCVLGTALSFLCIHLLSGFESVLVVSFCSSLCFASGHPDPLSLGETLSLKFG